MAPITRTYPNGISLHSDNESGASYDLAEDNMPPASTSSSKSNGKPIKYNKYVNLSDDNAVIDLTGEETRVDEVQNSMSPSWTTKISGIPMYCHADTSKNNDFLERKWLQSAEETTGESDVESLLSIDSGLGSLEPQAHEDLTILQAGATLQSASIEFQTQVKAIRQNLDNIHLGDETALPRDTRVRLREHARIIAYIFGDDVGELKRRIKNQNIETEKTIQKHTAELARTNIATREMIIELGKEKYEEIKSMHGHYRSEIQEIRNQYDNFEQRHQNQLALFKQKIGELAVDYLAYHALKKEHQKLKQQLRAATARNSALESQEQQWQDSQISQDRNQVLEMENMALKDKVTQVKAQLEHIQTGHKCTRDALAQLNEELKVLNKSKVKVNWALHQSLVTACMQVETLNQKLKQEQELKTASETSGTNGEPQPAADRPCPDCSAAEVELSNYRTHIAMHRKERAEIKEELVKSRGDNAKLERERKQLELQLHGTKLQLLGTTQIQDAAVSEVRQLRKQLLALQNELELAKATLDKEDIDAKKTQRNCLVLVQQQAVLKMRAEVAKKEAREEKEKFERLREKVWKNVEELVKRTGGLGSSSREILGISDELDEASA